MNIIFLDVDGVLNSSDWYRRRMTREEWAAHMGISPEPSRREIVAWVQRSIDPAAVGRLDRLVAETDARIVVSSTWRLMYALPKLDRILRERGYGGRPLLGTTPDKSFMPRALDKERHELRRGDEISAWLESYAQPCRYVILDDDSDMTVHMDRLVNTDPEWGLTDVDVETAVRLLSDTFAAPAIERGLAELVENAPEARALPEFDVGVVSPIEAPLLDALVERDKAGEK